MLVQFNLCVFKIQLLKPEKSSYHRTQHPTLQRQSISGTDFIIFQHTEYLLTHPRNIKRKSEGRNVILMGTLSQIIIIGGGGHLHITPINASNQRVVYDKFLARKGDRWMTDPKRGHWVCICT